MGFLKEHLISLRQLMQHLFDILIEIMNEIKEENFIKNNQHI